MANRLKGMGMSARLLDYLKDKFHIESDYALAQELGTSAPTLSRVRTGHKVVGANLILAIHDAFEMPIKDIKGMLNGGQNDGAN
jgi:transcriptional regulator with XRE-family HTH domain